MDRALQDEFRTGFYPDRQAGWMEDPIDEPGDVAADVSGYLSALESGRRDFAYPGHDRAVFRALERIVRKYEPKRGADIGCATGCFPAMQIAAGVERCTVFEVRSTEVNHDQVSVRVQDLTYAEDVEPEFDLMTCLSTIEHIGLGRYGDRLDPWGDLKMAANLRQLLRPGGIMLISFPVGLGCVVFNKHRIYTPYRQLQLFGNLRVLERLSDRSMYRQWRQRVAELLRTPGAFWQPIYVLEKPA